MTIRRSRLTHLGALAAAAALFAGCAGTGGVPTQAGATGAPVPSVAATVAAGATALITAPPAAGPIDACSLLTDVDIKELTGYEVDSMNPAPMDTIFPSACEWKLKGTPYLIALGVDSSGQAAWDRLVPYTQGDPVTGIGDQALHAEMGGDLMVRSGGTFFDIQYVAPGQPKDIQGKLAKRIVEHLS